jgi:phosphatidylinositol alpha-1,6-mannosyltransferase
MLKSTQLTILMLLSDAYGGYGGISQYNRDFLSALNASSDVKRVYVWPRIWKRDLSHTIPESVVLEREFGRGKGQYLLHALLALVNHPPFDLVICAHLHLLPIAWLIARMKRVRLSLVVFGIEAWRPTDSKLTNFLVSRVDSIVSITDFTLGKLQGWTNLPGIQQTIIPPCVDLSVFTPGPKSTPLIERYGLSSSRVLLTVGRLADRERYKGFDEVLAAIPPLIKKFGNLTYLIVGDGPDQARLLSKAESLGISKHVVFAGRVSDEEKIELYRLSDAYVMPSSGEGFGIVLIEAAACGVPVIGSQADGSREALLSGALGVLVDPLNSAQLVAEISQILEHKESHSRREAIRQFSKEEFVARVCDWISQIGEDISERAGDPKRKCIRARTDSQGGKAMPR